MSVENYFELDWLSKTAIITGIIVALLNLYAFSITQNEGFAYLSMFDFIMVLTVIFHPK